MSTVPQAITQRLQSILQSPFSIDYGYHSNSVILGPLIKVSLTAMQQFDCCVALDANHFAYTTPDDQRVQAAIPIASSSVGQWHSTRVDRQWNAPVLSLANTTPLTSLECPLAFEFCEASQTGTTDKPPNLDDNESERMQMLILYLTTTMLLTPSDSRELLLDLIRNGAHKLQWPYRELRTVTTWTTPFGPQVTSALRRAQPLYGPAVQSSIKTLQDNPSQFNESREHGRILEEEAMSQHNNFFTLAFVKPLPLYQPGTNGRCWAVPVDTSGNLQGAVVIHGAIVKKPRPVLLTFRTNPTQSEIEAALPLVVPDKELVLDLYTPPVRYQQTIGNRILFRIDGMRNARIWDAIMAPLVRNAVAVRRSVAAQGTSSSTSSYPAAGTATSGLKACIIYIRSSTAIQGDVGTSVERQFVSLLHKMGELITPGNLQRFEVMIEYSSSSQHPWQSRQFLGRKVREMNGSLILSANPDRVTRRADELDSIIAEFENNGCEWQTLGAQPTLEQWTLVHDQQERSNIKAQLKLSRNVAIQHGLYTRTVNTVTRLLNHERMNPLSPELGALKSFLKDVAKEFDHVLLWCRISPDFAFKTGKDAGNPPSIERQKAFLDTILAAVPQEKKHTELLDKVSAYNAHAVARLEKRVRGLAGRTLVVCTMVDRIIRNSAHLERIGNLLQEKNHQIMSILWDPLAFEQKHVSQCGLDWLALYPVRQTHHLSSPIVAPDVWYDLMTSSSSSRISATGTAFCRWSQNVLKHVTHAQAFCEGFRQTMFQGIATLQMPSGLEAEAGGRGFSPDRARRWEEHIKKTVNLQCNPKVNYVNASDTTYFFCACFKSSIVHDDTCLCPCKFCKNKLLHQKLASHLPLRVATALKPIATI
ncbi:hypothetical protein BG004_003264 [Podila humilis]|nr:hypothetical protein BG004_003264 [Podila humilis]